MGALIPSQRHLGRYHSALRAILAALERLLNAIRSPKVAMRISGPPTAKPDQPAGRGWGGDKSLSPGTGGEEGLASKKDLPKPLHALRHGGLGGFKTKALTFWEQARPGDPREIPGDLTRGDALW